jgi:hypothetical protein
MPRSKVLYIRALLFLALFALSATWFTYGLIRTGEAIFTYLESHNATGIDFQALIQTTSAMLLFHWPAGILAVQFLLLTTADQNRIEEVRRLNEQLTILAPDFGGRKSR